MVYNFTIRTNKGKPESLKQPIKIAFTLTPVDSRAPTSAYDTVVRWVRDFPANSEQMQSVQWGSSLAFDTYETRNGQCVLSDVVSDGDMSKTVPPGQFVTMQAIQGSRNVRWLPPATYSNHVAAKQFSVMAVNHTGAIQRVALLLQDPDPSPNYEAILAYRPIGHGTSCIAPSELLLQAYVVEDALVQMGSVLTAEQRTHPMFPSPLSCDTLPMSSMWKLFQSDGLVRLKSDSQQNFTLETKVDTLAKSVAELDRAMQDIQQHLLNIEKSAQKPPDYTSPTASNPGLDRRILKLEDQTEKLTKTFVQTQEYLMTVQKFLQTTKQQVAGLDRKVPAAEAKTDKLAEGLGQTRDEIFTMQESLTATANRVAGLDSRVTIIEEGSERLQQLVEKVKEAGGWTSVESSPGLFPRDPSRPLIPSAELLDDELPRLPPFSLS